MQHEKLSALPTSPGVYLFKNKRHKVLYVGKAKNLRARVRSYFQEGAALEARKAKMAAEVADLDYLVTASELEAFILEASLIKRHKPPYNVILRDDKNYPYLRLTVREEWPKLEVTRRTARDGSLYFGPYVPAGIMWETLAFIRRTFPIRTCKYRLDRPMRPCVEYQMKRCAGPCAGKIEHADYMRVVREVRLFLEGKSPELLERLRARMDRASRKMEYEEAARLRDRIALIEKAWESQRIISPTLGDIDVFAVYQGTGGLTIQTLIVRSGTVMGGRSFFIKGHTGDSPASVLASAIDQYYAKDILPPREILLPMKHPEARLLEAWLSERAEGKVTVRVVPKKGKRAELMKMAEDNALISHTEHTSGKLTPVMLALKDQFRLGTLPSSIHAFDISTLSGTESVGSRIVWSEGRFMKDDYRRFSIRSVSGMDDFKMMREIISRSYAEEDTPDLILIDGGRGQLEMALKALRELGKEKTDVIALAKMKHGLPERVYTRGAGRPVRLDPLSPATQLLQKLRDETHRFGITYHRKKRASRALSSPLESIPGIGKSRRLALLKHFGSIAAITDASREELCKIPGIKEKTAEAILTRLKEGVKR